MNSSTKGIQRRRHSTLSFQRKAFNLIPATFLLQRLKPRNYIKQFCINRALPKPVVILVWFIQHFINVLLSKLHGFEATGVFRRRGFCTGFVNRDKKVFPDQYAKGTFYLPNYLWQVLRRPGNF